MAVRMFLSMCRARLVLRLALPGRVSTRVSALLNSKTKLINSCWAASRAHAHVLRPSFIMSDSRCGEFVPARRSGRSRAVWRPKTLANGGKIAESATFSCGFARQVHDYVALSVILKWRAAGGPWRGAGVSTVFWLGVRVCRGLVAGWRCEASRGVVVVAWCGHPWAAAGRWDAGGDG
jgi:hypothetical protein